MEKRIKYEDFKKKLSFGEYGKTVKVTVCGRKVTVAQSLNYNDVLYFVEYVANACFTDEGVYVPQVRQTMFRSAVLDMFTDIEVPVEMEEKFAFAEYSDVYEAVVEAISEKLLYFLNDLVSEKIDYLIRQNTESVKADLQKTTGMLQSVAQTMQEMAKGFDTDAISGLMTALDKNTADRNQLIAAYGAKADAVRREAEQADKNGND